MNQLVFISKSGRIDIMICSPRKIGIIVLLAVLYIVSGLSSIASAAMVTDDSDDVLHWRYDSQMQEWSWSSQPVSDHPSIDILNLSYTVEGYQLTVSMTVKDVINSSRPVGYLIYYGNLTGSYYVFQYVPYLGGGLYYAIGIQDYTQGEIPSSPVSEDGKTITASFPITYTEPTFQIWGRTYEYNASQFYQNEQKENIEYWADVSPETIVPFGGPTDWYNDTTTSQNEDEGSNDTTNDSSNESNEDATEKENQAGGDTKDSDETQGTPGFELLVALIAFFLLILRKKKT